MSKDNVVPIPVTAPIVRTALSKRLRFEVFKRDGFKCAYCGAHPPQVILHCDHIHPVAEGGTNDIDNLVTACVACNQGKSDKLLSDVPLSLAERAADVAEREEQIAGYQGVMRDRRGRIEADAEDVLDSFCQAFGRDSIPMNDFRSIRRFVDELGLDEVLWSVDRAAQQHRNYRKAFLYFCGICWRKIRERDGEA